MYFDEFVQLQNSIAEFIYDQRSNFITQAEYNSAQSFVSGNPRVIAMIGDAALRSAALLHFIDEEADGMHIAPGTLQRKVESVISNGNLVAVYDLVIGTRIGKSYRDQSYFKDETPFQKFNINEKSKGLFIEILLGLSIGSELFDGCIKIACLTQEEIKRFTLGVEALHHIYDDDSSFGAEFYLNDSEDCDVNYSIYDEEAPTPEETVVSYDDWLNAYQNYGKSAYNHFIRYTPESILDGYKERFKSEKPQDSLM